MEKTHVLIIEDDPLLAGLLTRMIAQENDLEGEFSVNAEDGMRKLEENLPDIILLDLILPGMHGFDFLEKIKNEERTKKIPVVILSNLGDKGDVARGRELGAADYMIKANIVPRDIIDKVKEIVR